MWDEITAAASAESRLWAEALRPVAEQEREPVFSPLAPPEHALGLETIYEGYLVHFGRSRLFAPGDHDTALLLGDYLYAHGLVHIAATGDVDAVSDLAELISLCAQARADGRDGDGAVWAATASALGAGGLDEARAAMRERGDPTGAEAAARRAAGEEVVAAALAVHRRYVSRSDPAGERPPSATSGRPEAPR